MMQGSPTPDNVIPIESFLPAKRKMPVKHDKAEWECWKSTLHEQFIVANHTVDEVVQYMFKEYGFEASKQQYERRFKHWGFAKNLTKKQWDPIVELSKRGLLQHEDIKFPQVDLPLKRIKQAVSRYKHAQPSLGSKLFQENPMTDKLSTLEVVLRSIILVILDCDIQPLGCSLARDGAIAKYLSTFSSSQIHRVFQEQVTTSHIRNLPTWLLKRFTSVSIDEDRKRFSTKFGLLRLKGELYEALRSTFLKTDETSELTKDFVFCVHCAAQGLPITAYPDLIQINVDQMQSTAHVLLGMLCTLVSISRRHPKTLKPVFDCLQPEGLLELKSMLDRAGICLPEKIIGELMWSASDRNEFYSYMLFLGLGADVSTIPEKDDVWRAKPRTLLQEAITKLSRGADAVDWQNLINQLLRFGASPNHCGQHVRERNGPCCKDAPICHVLDGFLWNIPYAAAFRNVLKKLLRYGAKVMPQFDLLAIIEQDWGAADAVDIELISLLITGGAPAEGVEDPVLHGRFFCPLQFALDREDTNLSLCLLEHLKDRPLGCSPRIVQQITKKRLKTYGPIYVAIQHDYRSPLALAISYNLELAQKLISMGADINSCYLDMLEESTDDSIRDFRSKFVELYCLRFIRSIKIGNLTIKGSETTRPLVPLSAAIEKDNVEAVRMALQAGADTVPRFGCSPMIMAVIKGDYSIAKLLLRFGTKMDLFIPVTCSIDYCFITAWRLNLWEKQRLLSPLAIASAKGDVDMVRLLLENGADINYTGQGLSPLIAAIINEEQDVIDILLAHPNIDLFRPTFLRTEPHSKLHIRPFYWAIVMRNIKLTHLWKSHTENLERLTLEEMDLLTESFERAVKMQSHAADHEWIKTLLDINRKLRMNSILRVDFESILRARKLETSVKRAEYGQTNHEEDRESAPMSFTLFNKEAAEKDWSNPFRIGCEGLGWEHDTYGDPFRSSLFWLEFQGANLRTF